MRRPVALPTATEAGPASSGHQSGSEVSIRSITPGRCSPASLCRRSSKICPVRAASWWAITTRVRSASRSPASATTFQVGLRSIVALRQGRSPFEMSSAISAVEAAPAIAARRRPRPLSATSPEAAAIAASLPIIPA